MTAVSLALAATMSWIIGAIGWRMASDPGDLMRRYQGGDLASTSVRRSPITNLVTRAGDRLAPAVRAATPATVERWVGATIDAAGRPDAITVDTYATRKAQHLVVAAAVAVMALSIGMTGFALLVGLGSLAFEDLRLSRLARQRQEEIERTLPDYLDITAVVVQAGAGFEEALTTVADELGGPLAEEIRTTLGHLELGGSRRQAFRALAQRNPGETMTVFVASLLQADELGAPLARTLAGMAGELRTDVTQRAKRRATKAGGKISLVVSTLFLPGMMVLLGVGLFLTTGSDGGGLFGG